MQGLRAVPGGPVVQANQLLYNLGRRGIESDLLPWLRRRRVPVMAYSPVEQARLLRHPGLVRFGQRHCMLLAQAALAWMVGQGDVIAIPKTAHPAPLRENFAAVDITLGGQQRTELDALCSLPQKAVALEML